MTGVSRRSFLLTGGTATAAGVLTGAGATLLAPAAGAATGTVATEAGPSPAADAVYVAAGQTYTVAATTRVSAVTIERAAC